MAIIELPQLKYLRAEGSIDYGLKSNEKLQNLTLSSENYYNNSTSLYDEIYYHKNNLGFLLVIMISFFILSYYLYYVSKYNIKKAKSNSTESTIVFMKYTNLQNLSIATFRKLKKLKFSSRIEYNIYSSFI